MLLDQFKTMKVHIAHYEQEIEKILENLPESNSIKSLPGVGNRLAPELIAALGPSSKDSHHRFQSAEEIAKLSGCVPVIRQSGKWEKIAIRYGCVRPLRRTFHDWAFTSLKTSSWARAYYNYSKARN